VPKKYLTQVGEDAFKKHPIGAGPYRFVSQKPGLEVELEANTGYWRRVPNVKTLILKSVPEATTRAVMVKTGEADIGYVLDGPEDLDARIDELALRARGAGSLRIATELEGDCVLVHVADDGCGIAPEHVGRIFDPFFTTKRVGEGSGLGLGIAHGIVRSHGGEIRVTSRVGGGSRFSVHLPIAADTLLPPA